MLRVIQNTSAGGAKSYYGKPDYYIGGANELELPGQWRGEGARRLGLAGNIEQADWESLCDNLNPNTGQPLTVRRKQDRSVGYDFNFHVPKSLSLLYALGQDPRLLEAVRRSVIEAMNGIEADMQTRVRLGGKNENRVTGNLVYGEFIHFTSRPVDGVPDPHLHAHCFVHNVTFDEAEKRWKAGQFRDLKRDAPLYEARFHANLARRLQELGVEVIRTKNAWEVDGLSKSTLDKFSRRTKLIEELAQEKGITSEVDKDQLGAKTRENKQSHLSMDQLRAEWRSRLNTDENSALIKVVSSVGGARIPERLLTADATAALAVDHCFERKSVVPERVLLAEAIKRSVGLTSAAVAEQAVERQDLIRGDQDGRRFVTSRHVLAEEQRMLNFAREGRGGCPLLGSVAHRFRREFLNEGQRQAVLHVLTSHDRVMIIKGVAGGGKTTSMQEAVEAIECGGTKVLTFAPSAAASRGVLVSDGFKNAETVARLLKDEKMQEQARGSVLWIDEAGLLGVKTMAEVFDLAERIDARVILSGDHQQHGSVERGAALRLLETEAGLVPAEIKDIQRQSGAYKQAVRAISQGKIEQGFKDLSKLGWIREMPDDVRCQTMASDYVSTVASGKSALVVSPTHAESHRITAAIRAELKNRSSKKKQKGRIPRIILGSEERAIAVLNNGNLTQGERSDGVNYSTGDVLVFHQNARRFKKGDRVVVGDKPLPLEHADKFTAFHVGDLNVAPGELLRVTQNGKTKDGHRLNNGQIITVKKFDEHGDIVLTNGWVVAKDFGHLAYGYVVTSHASQGRTVDRVLIGQSAESFPASSENQFYVSVSRAREKATIYTNDKAALLQAVSRPDERLSATEFVNERTVRTHALTLQRMQASSMSPPRDQPVPTREEIFHER